MRLLKHLILTLGLLAATWGGGAAQAQDGVWIQVEAQPTLTQAQDRARAYAGQFPDVAGFYLGTGWYGVVLGPYGADDADRFLRQLRSAGQIPRDSYLTSGEAFRQQFWPIGTGVDPSPRPLPGGQTEPAVDPQPAVDTPAIDEPAVAAPAQPDESRSEALASEERLSRPEREALQVAMQWAGFYQGAIDGAFGRGTRGAMEAWQIANGHPATGVLTTAQRGQLIDAYNAILAGLDLTRVRDDAAGIEITLPMGIVEFTAYDPPFARYAARDGGLAQVLLISQPGDAARLAGLYEILQTLEIIPEDGERARRDASFEINGQDAERRTYATAAVADGAIKGFILTWPAGDDERFTRLLAEVKASFAALPGALDPAIAPPDEDQAIDLISGLAIRQPRETRAGFFISREGDVLTSARGLGQCSQITLASGHEASLAWQDEALGLAVLRPGSRLAPRGVAAFQTAVPRLMSEIAVAGFPYGPVLNRPTLTFGRLADLRGLNGEEDIKRLELRALPGDAGGPVFDNGGAVLGMLLPRADDGAQLLPEDVAFSLDSDVILGALAGAGIAAQTTDSLAFIAPETLTRQAADMTVLVNCW